MKRRRKWLLTLLAVAALLAVGGLWGGMGALDRYLDPFDDQPFDSFVWATANWDDRAPMAREAIRHLPPGTPAARVRELLGVPHPDIFEKCLNRPERWSYYLGSWCGLGPYGFDDAFLYVHFDQQGRVVASEIGGG